MSTLPENTLPWRPVADTIRLIADTKPATRQTVLILGAGMAGLGAANELAKHDDVAHVHIVEGRKHNACVVGVGGRVMTHRFGSAPEADEADGRPYHELGAMRVPHLTHDYTWHYIRELGLKRESSSTT
jgi:monoamine oxidase